MYRLCLVVLILNNFYCMYDFVDMVDLTAVFANYKLRIVISYFILSVLFWTVDRIVFVS